MKKPLPRCLLFAALLGAAGCHLVTGSLDGDSCPWEYSSRYGCLRVVVIMQTPPEPWPRRYIWDLRAEAAREGTGLGQTLGASPNQGVNRLHLVRRDPPYPDVDTASVWISSKILDNTKPQVGVRLPVFAGDSVLIVADFRRSRPDTVRLTLRP